MNTLPKHPADLHSAIQQMSKSEYSADFLNTQYLEIPIPFTQLIGREQEVEEVCNLLKHPEVRLLTLIGPGGVGKTRLARQVLADLQQSYADGCAFVALGSINAPSQVLPEIHRALSLLRFESGSFLMQLQDYLEDKRFLLVLDNFEQVITAAPLLLELLSACPGLNLLVTSRFTLGVQGEYEFVVPPLALPDMKHLPSSETLSHVAAVALFVQRAQTVTYDFQVTDANARTIAAICTRLDGLPLAIELAAARIKLLSPTALLARLERRLQVLTGGGPDLPRRQQTIHDTIKWSYDLLSADEQLLFCRLAVFVGGCTLEAIETFSESLGGASISVLDGVNSLLNKSLLQRDDHEEGEPRLQMLETVHEYGMEELAARGELEMTRDAHARYYQAFVQKSKRTLLRMWQEPKLTQLEREYLNLLIALEWSLEQKEAAERIERILQLAAALGQIWFNRGELSKARSIVERALAASSESSAPIPTQSQANALFVGGTLAYWQYDYEQASYLLEEALVCFRALGDHRGIVSSLNRLGITQILLGKTEAGHAMLEEVLELCRRVGDVEGVADNLLNQGDAAFYCGEFVQAQAYCEESLRLYTQSGDVFGKAVTLLSLGWIAYCRGEYVKARQFTEESVKQFSMCGHAGFEIEAMTLLAFAKVARGEVAEASALLEEVLNRGKDQKHPVVVAQALWGLGRLALDQNELLQARTLFEEGLASMNGRIIHTRFKWVIASCLEGLGEIALAQGRPVWTTWLYGAADAFRTIQGYRNLLGMKKAHYEHVLAEARDQLGKKTFTAFWEEGRRMTPEQALAAEGQTPMMRQASKDIIAQIGAEQQLDVSSSHSNLPEILTVREIEVLRLVAEGLTNKQIAKRLVISPSTVDTHIQSIYSRLGISSRSAATRYAIEHSLM